MIARKCGRCGRVGHTVRTCTEPVPSSSSVLSAPGTERVDLAHPVDLLGELAERTPMPAAEAEARHAAFVHAAAETEQRIAEPWGPLGPTWVPWRTPWGPDGITRPGIHPLTPDEYHHPAITGRWLSHSGARRLADTCPAQLRYDLDHPAARGRSSEALDFGTLLHFLLLGVGPQIVVRPDRWDSWRTDAAKAWRAEQEQAGRIVVLPDMMAKAQAMAAAVLANPDAAELLGQPGRAEACLFWEERLLGPTGPLTARRRTMVDWLPDPPEPGKPLVIVDVKTTETPPSPRPDGPLARKATDLDYHRQAATLADGCRAVGWDRGQGVIVAFVFVSKEAPYLVGVMQWDWESLRIAHIENARVVGLFAECEASGVWPGYTTGLDVLSVPGWYARRFDGVDE